MLRAKRSYSWLALALLFVLIRALPNLTYPLGRAQATYGVVAQGLLRGDKLYRDIWDIKPPAIFWVYEAIVKVCGSVMWSVGALDIVWLLLLSWCIFRFTEGYLGRAKAVIAVVINASWHCRVGYLNAGHPENFLILLVFAAYFQVWREGGWSMARHFLAGLLMGIAFWFKFDAVAFLALLVLVPYLDLSGLDAQPMRLRLTVPWRTVLRQSFVLLCGLALVVAAVLVHFWTTGLWNALRETLDMASRYAASPLRHRRGYSLAVLGTIVHILGPLTALVPVIGFLVARKARELARLAPVLFGTAVACVSIALQAFVHTYAIELCYPFFAATWGYLLVKAFQKLRDLEREAAETGSSLERVLLWFILTSLVVLPVLLESLSLAQHYRQLWEWSRNRDSFYARYAGQHHLEHLEGELQVSRYLKENSAPGDKVYVWGAAALIYYLTGRRSPTRFVPNFPLMAEWGTATWRDQLMRALRRSPPAFLVVARNDEAFSVTFTRLDSEQYLKCFPELNALISGYYYSVATFPDFIIYRRVSRDHSQACDSRNKYRRRASCQGGSNPIPDASLVLARREFFGRAAGLPSARLEIGDRGEPSSPA